MDKGGAEKLTEALEKLAEMMSQRATPIKVRFRWESIDTCHSRCPVKESIELDITG
jgi:hypothetical protein